MSDAGHLYEEIVRLTVPWIKEGYDLYPPFHGQPYEEFVRFTDGWIEGGGSLPPSFSISAFAALTRDDLSRVGSSSLRRNRKVGSNGHGIRPAFVQSGPTFADHFGGITKMVGVESTAQRHG